MRTIIITLLLLAATSAVVAQEKWEYAVVRYTQPTINTRKEYFIYTSKPEGISAVSDKVEDIWNNFVPLVKHLGTLSEQGWEVVSTTHEGPNSTYLLKRKKN